MDGVAPFSTPGPRMRWSRGERIAFLSNESGPYRLYVANADGGDRRPLSSLATVDESWGLAVSNDGSQLAVVGRESVNGPSGMYRVDAGAERATRLVAIEQSRARDGSQQSRLVPTWSEDDRSILFIADADTCEAVPADGGEPGAWPLEDCYNRLLFEPAPSGGVYAGVLFTALVLVDPKEPSARVLATVTSEEDLGEGALALALWMSIGATRPAWSPDGRSVAYGAEGGLHIIPAAGGEPRLLWDSPGDLIFLSPMLWSDDGRWIIASSWDDQSLIWRVDVQSGAAQQILGGSYQAMFPAWVSP